MKHRALYIIFILLRIGLFVFIFIFSWEAWCCVMAIFTLDIIVGEIKVKKIEKQYKKAEKAYSGG